MQEDIEGKSIFCYALLRLRTDSAKLRTVAQLGVEPEDSEYVFSEKGVEITTSEWQKHITSAEKWNAYQRELKANCVEHRRYGLLLRITAITDSLMEMGWDGGVAEIYLIPRVQEEAPRQTPVR